MFQFTQQNNAPQTFAPTAVVQSQGPAPPIPPMRITKDYVFNSATNYPLFRLDSSAAAGSLSSSSLVTVVRTANGLPLGNVRYHSLDDSRIDLSINGRETKLKNDGFSTTRWVFKPVAFPGVKWCWTKAKSGGLRLTDAKDGRKTIATLTGDVLVVDPIGLDEGIVDEVVLASVAIKEFRRRKGKEDQEAVESLDAIGNIAGALAGGGA